VMRTNQSSSVGAWSSQHRFLACLPAQADVMRGESPLVEPPRGRGESCALSA